MEERRRSKRLDLDVSVQLERLDTEGMTTLKFIHVDVVDVSKTGIGFTATQKLEAGTYYDMKLQIWTKEVIHAFIEIVRIIKEADTFSYGGIFIGMPEMDAARIAVYDTVKTATEEE